jgi:hypothetical protein
MERISSRPTLTSAGDFIDASQSVVQRTSGSLEGGSSERNEWRNELSTPTGNQLRIADPVRFEGTVQFAELPEQPLEEVEVGVTVVDALNKTRFHFSNTVKTDISNFLYGQEGQEIILLGDGHTEVLNNTNIVNHSASAVKLDNGVAYKWCYMLGKWRQVK